jgi:hypothetical protein
MPPWQSRELGRKWREEEEDSMGVFVISRCNPSWHQWVGRHVRKKDTMACHISEKGNCEWVLI